MARAWHCELERWHWLLFHRTRVQFPATTCWLTTIHNSSSGLSYTLFRPPGAWHAHDTQLYIQANTYIRKIIFKKFKTLRQLVTPYSQSRADKMKAPVLSPCLIFGQLYILIHSSGPSIGNSAARSGLDKLTIMTVPPQTHPTGQPDLHISSLRLSSLVALDCVKLAELINTHVLAHAL